MDAMDSDGVISTALLAFIVLPENDPPVLESTSATHDTNTRTHDGMSDVIESVSLITTKEDREIAVSGLSLRDIDFDISEEHIFGGGPSSADSGLVEVTFSASNGTISLRNGLVGYIFLVGDGLNDRILAFRASLAGANRALAGLTYRGLPDFYGTDDLIITVDDCGNYGWGALCEGIASRGVKLGDDNTPCPHVSTTGTFVLTLSLLEKLQGSYYCSQR